MTDFPTPAGSTPERQATAREFIAVLFRRKWIIIGLFATTTLTVLALALFTPTIYLSSGRVLYKRGEQTSLLLGADRRIYNDWEQELGSELELVKSHAVIEKARALLKAEATPARPAPDLDAGSIAADVVGKSNVISIGYTDREPAVAHTVCDAVIRAYLDYRQHDLTLTYPKGFFDAELAQVRNELDRMSAERLRFTNESRIVSLDDQDRTMLNNLSSIEQQRATLQADLAEARTTMASMRELQRRPDIDLPIPTNPVGVDLLFQLKQKILDQETKIAQLRERYRDESPEVSNALTTLTTLKDMLKREVEMRIEVLDSRTRSLEARLVALNRESSRIQGDLETMPAKATRLEDLDRQITVLKRRYEDLVSKSDLANVTENTIPTSTVLLLSAAGPARPTNAHDYVRLGLVPAFALVVGVALAFFIDGLDITIRTAGHAEEAMDLPVLATLPERRRRRA